MFSRLRAGLTFANVIAMVALIVAVGGGSVAWGLFQTSPDRNGYVQACWNVNSRDVRVIDPDHGEKCRSQERRLSWNGRRRAPDDAQRLVSRWETNANPARRVLRMPVSNGRVEIAGRCYFSEGRIAFDLDLTATGGGPAISHSRLRFNDPNLAPVPLLSAGGSPARLVELRVPTPGSQRQQGNVLVRLPTREGERVAHIDYTAAAAGQAGRPGICDLFGFALVV
jgi:hypothetical protein